MNVDNIYTSYDLLSNSLYSNYCANCFDPYNPPLIWHHYLPPAEEESGALRV